MTPEPELMQPTWPMPLVHQVAMRIMGFTPYGHHERFVAWWRQCGSLAIVEYFVIHPQLRLTGYVLVAFEDMRAFLRERGVKTVLAVAFRGAPLWKRLGFVETEPGYLRGTV